MQHNDSLVLSAFVRSMIRRTARQMVGRVGFTAQDRQDLEQELLLRLLQSIAQFDPAQSHFNAYATAVINRQVAMILRQRRAKKRGTRPLQSLDALCGTDHSHFEPPEGSRPGDQTAPLGAEGRLDLALDLEALLPSLPPDLRDLASRLMVGSASQVARDLSIARTSMLRQVEHLRRRFEAAGLRAYL
jgi:RNA polymerase sigma factor (sigma-70 family)